MSGFAWFDTEEEMDEFIEESKLFEIKVIDAVHIINAENLCKG